MDAIFTLWPSVAALASDLRKPYPTVHAWKQRGSIPARYDAQLIAAAAARGETLTLQMLADARARSEQKDDAA